MKDLAEHLFSFRPGTYGLVTVAHDTAAEYVLVRTLVSNNLCLEDARRSQDTSDHKKYDVMITGRASNWVVAIGMMIFVAVTGLVWLSHHWNFTDFCPADEQQQVARCVRDWTAALSGYFATVAAAVTVFFLAQQNAAIKKQADFQLGDALPSMDAAVLDKNRRHAHIRIVNWNRRSISISNAQLVKPGFYSLVNRVEVNGTRVEGAVTNYDHQLDRNVLVKGWEDRNGPPNRATIILLALEGGVLVDFDYGDQFEVSLQIFDENHRPVVLTAIAGIKVD